MNLFELFVKIGVDDQASGKLKELSSKLGNGLKAAAKIGTAAVATAAAGITALTKAAVDNYAEYEQLVGGVETLFKDSAGKVQEYASNAYKTAGMSANEYMSTVTSFSASLLQSLGGDTEAAVNFADMAISDMSDNANKMGTSMEMIQNAYQGFAKQNYTMLDNLKLGYGGTKTEMERLLRDAEKMGGLVEGAFDIESFADIVEAINIVQTEIGITGTTALEAGRTISGSVGAMKSAWTNLLTGLADGNADIEQLVNNLVETIVGDGTENNIGVFGNIMPAVRTALGGASKLIRKLVPAAIKEIPKILKENLPVLVEAAVSIFEETLSAIDENKDMVFDMILELVAYISESFIEMLPKIVELGLDVIVSVASGLAQGLPQLLPATTEIVFEIVKILTDKKTLSNILTAALSIIDALVEYLLADDTLDQLIDAAVTIIITIAELLIENVDKLFDAAVKIIEKIVEYITDPDNLLNILSAGATIIGKLGEGFLGAIGSLGETIANIADFIFEKFLGIDLSEAGEKALQSFLSGMTPGFLGLTIQPNVHSVVGSIVNGSHKTGLDYVPYDGYIAELHKGERVLTASEANRYPGNHFGDINIYVNGDQHRDEEALAEAIAEKLQLMTDRRGAVYGK